MRRGHENNTAELQQYEWRRSMRNVREMAQTLAYNGNVSVGCDAAYLHHYSVIEYACPVCGETYLAEEDAMACSDQRYDTGGLEVGDIVVVPRAWHNWIPKDDPWLAFILPPNPNSDSHFDRAGYRVPYFVVTAVHTDWLYGPHRCVVTLCSLAEGRLRCGWNPANGDGHYAMFRWDSDKHCDVGSKLREQENIDDLLDNCEPCDIVKREAAELASMRISTTRLL
jgi:hypothetical protein